MQQIIFYMKDNCPLCDDARAKLELLRHEYPIEIEERNIETDEEWLAAYQFQIPVIQTDHTTLNCEQITYEALERMLSASN